MRKRIRKADKIDLLARLALFESCTRRELGQIADMTVESEKPAGSYLTREGKDGGLLFVLVDGEAEILAGDGDEVIGRLGAGDVIGELSLIDGQARSASVRALSEVHVLQLAADDFRGLVRDSPQFVRNLLRALSLKVREMDELTS